MKTAIQEKIAFYKFQDSHRQVYSTIIGNFLSAFGFFMSNPVGVFNNPYALICFFTAVLLLIVHRIYDWQTNLINWGIVVLYLLIYFLEIIFFGVPPALVSLSNRVSKGILLELFTALIPWIYTGLRLVLVIFLIQIVMRSQQVKKIKY